MLQDVDHRRPEISGGSYPEDESWVLDPELILRGHHTPEAAEPDNGFCWDFPEEDVDAAGEQTVAGEHWLDRLAKWAARRFAHI